MIKVDQLVCGYHVNKPIVGPLSFRVQKGEVVCLIGPNGVGKTTLFKTILGLLKPQAGTISLAGKDALAYSAKEFARTVAYVPQGHIPPFPYLVRDVVVMGCNPHMRELSAPKAEEYRVVDEVLDLLDISHLAERDYTEISGGERQMVMIARALAQRTNLIVMDEPTTHLDYGNETRVLREIRKLAGLGYTIIMVTHVPDHAFICADRVIAIGHNGFYRAGTPDEVLTEDTLYTLYGEVVEVTDIKRKEDQKHIRICVPISII